MRMQPADETDGAWAGFREPEKDNTEPPIGVGRTRGHEFVPGPGVGDAGKRLARGRLSRAERSPDMVLCENASSVSSSMLSNRLADRYQIYSMMWCYRKHSR